LYSRIAEARHKSIAALGDALFWKVYEVCHRHMYADYVVDDDEEEEGSAEQRKTLGFQQELEAILYDDSNQNHNNHHSSRLDLPWEAIMNVKVLLALESKYDYLIDQPHNNMSSSNSSSYRRK